VSRPLYETEQDRQNEQALATLVSERFNCTMHKMPMKYTLDFAAARDGEVVAFLEMRQRKINRDRFDTYMISLNKILRAEELGRVTGLPCFLVIQWTDAVGMCRLDTCDYKVEIGGSTRRGDWQDIEPVAHIPINQFAEIAT
jgi:hypothetical protein